MGIPAAVRQALPPLAAPSGAADALHLHARWAAAGCAPRLCGAAVSSSSPFDGTLSRRDRLVASAVSIGVLLLYVASFASVPTSDGLVFVANVDRAYETGAMPTFSNAPFSYHLTLLLKRAAGGTGLEVPTLRIFQGINSLVFGMTAAPLFLTIWCFRRAPYCAFVATALVLVSLAVWYFDNVDVHNVVLAILH